MFRIDALAIKRAYTHDITEIGEVAQAYEMIREYPSGHFSAPERDLRFGFNIPIPLAARCSPV